MRTSCQPRPERERQRLRGPSRHLAVRRRKTPKPSGFPRRLIDGIIGDAELEQMGGWSEMITHASGHGVNSILQTPVYKCAGGVVDRREGIVAEVIEVVFKARRPMGSKSPL